MPTVVDPRTSIVPTPQHAPFRKRIAFAIGRILALVMRTRANAIESGTRIRAPHLLDRLIRNGIQAQALQERDHVRLRDIHRNYWSKEALKFGSDYGFRFEEQFLQFDVEMLRVAFKHFDRNNLDSVIELGCGNGKVLEYVSQQIASCEEFIGIDIDPNRIDANKHHYEGQQLEFVTGNALSWLQTHVKPSMMLMTNGGVLEYFLHSEVIEIFELAAQQSNTAIALIETVGSDHDLDKDTQTHPYGREFAFSHNYLHLLKEAGFKIRHFSERRCENGDRWVRIFATH